MNVSGIEIGAFKALCDNGGTGDYKVELCVGLRVDGRGKEPFLITNGDPILIQVEASELACSIEQAAKVLNISDEHLRGMVLKHIPGIDW